MSVGEMVIGVVADTHVPDRKAGLNPELLPALEAARVERIIHLGDVCVNRVLDELAQVAPVEAVRGNRDWLVTPTLPWERRYAWCGVNVVAAHGHGSFVDYWVEKAVMALSGYDFESYQRRLLKRYPGGQVYLFGHSHRPVIRWVEGVMFFNPGSALHNHSRAMRTPSFGLLRLAEGEEPRAAIVPLKREE